MTVGHKSPIGLDGSLPSRLETQVEIVRSAIGRRDSLRTLRLPPR